MAKKLGSISLPKEANSADFLNVSKLTKPCRVRLVGEIQPAYRYWIPTKDGKKYPIIAKGFNPETESWDKIDEDPLFPIALSNFQGVRKEFAYAINCIDREDGSLKILTLKRTILNEIMALVNNPEYGDPTDPENGYDITITKVKTGDKAWNVKYTVTPGRTNTPLTDEEKELELHDLSRMFSPPEPYVEFIKEKSNILDEFELNAGETITDNEEMPY